MSYPRHLLEGVLSLCRDVVGIFYSPSRLGWSPIAQGFDWKKVQWTDESKFELFESKRIVLVKRTLYERLSENCKIVQTKYKRKFNFYKFPNNNQIFKLFKTLKLLALVKTLKQRVPHYLGL